MESPRYAETEEFTMFRDIMEKCFIKQDYKTCLARLMELAERNYGPAENTIASIYNKGLGVKEDDEQVLYWIKRAAEHGDWVGQFNLAMIYELGEVVEKDDMAALEWLKKSAAQGYPPAVEKLNSLCEK